MSNSKDSTQTPDTTDGMAVVAYVMVGFFVGVVSTLIALGVFG